jgi:hypothetical protein
MKRRSKDRRRSVEATLDECDLDHTTRLNTGIIVISNAMLRRFMGSPRVAELDERSSQGLIELGRGHIVVKDRARLEELSHRDRES